ncbi:MAG: GGDEF domain-containing protein [Terracidiphilus sp.]
MRPVSALTFILGCASVAWPVEPGVLTTLHDVVALSNAEASRALPVAFEATVTYYNRAAMNLVVQDEGAAIYVYAALGIGLVPGDRVLVRGTTQNSFRPVVISNDVTKLSHGELPKPVVAGFDEMIRGERDCMLVTVRGTVRAADLISYADTRLTDLQLLIDGGYIEALVDSSDANALKELLDTEVEVTGVVSGKFDGKKQLTGIALFVSKLADVKILKRAGADFKSLPVTPMDKILRGYHIRDSTSRIRVQGTITYYRPGSAIALESGATSLWINTQTDQPLRIGDLADASGFPDVTNGFMTLTRGEIVDTHEQAPIAPRPVTWEELSSGWNEFDLVSAEGWVLMAVREAAQDEYVLVLNGHLFSAVFRHPNGVDESQLPPMKKVPVGSKIRVSGICTLFSSDPMNGPLAFDILLRSPEDITLVGTPTWFNVFNLGVAAGVLFILLLAAGTRSWILDRKLRRQTAELAYIERRRSRILEDINGSRPLAENLEQITELVSFKLKGAPCWCQIADGAQLGNRPPKVKALRIAQQEIPARSGPALGVIFAGLDPLTSPHSTESEALTMAAALSALAIETQRTYSDLRHRSEFDLLTDIHNRFSFEKQMETAIEAARQSAGIFGLLYIDLDDFKQVNDQFGHHTGDLYLQEAALRIKHQLRSGDILARLGGDEFAVTLPNVRSRADVEEITLRLERGFEQPFTFEDCTVHGTASFGVATYPADGATRDSLLSAADTAMYVIKQTRRQKGETLPAKVVR